MNVIITITDHDDNLHIIKNVITYQLPANGIRVTVPHLQRIPAKLPSRIITNGTRNTCHEITNVKYFSAVYQDEDNKI